MFKTICIKKKKNQGVFLGIEMVYDKGGKLEG